MQLASSIKIQYVTFPYSFTNVRQLASVCYYEWILAQLPSLTILQQVVQLKAVTNARKVTVVYWESALHVLTHQYLIKANVMTVSCMFQIGTCIIIKIVLVYSQTVESPTVFHVIKWILRSVYDVKQDIDNNKMESVLVNYNNPMSSVAIN